MDGVKDRYSKHESVDGQHIGRCTCGLNPLSANFTISSLHFNFLDSNNTIKEIEKCKKIEN